MSTVLHYNRKIEGKIAKLKTHYLNIETLKKEIDTVFHFFEYISNHISVPMKIERKAIGHTGKALDICLPAQGNWIMEELLHLVMTRSSLDYSLDINEFRIFLKDSSATSHRYLKVETYEVSDLVMIGAGDGFDYPEMELERDDDYQVFGLNFEEILDNNQPYYTESNLAQLISEKVLKKRWPDFPVALVSTRPGQLFVSHLPQIHQEIQQFLDKLRDLARTPITLDNKYIACKNNFFKQMELEFTPFYSRDERNNTILLYSYLTQEQEKNLFQAIEESKDATICQQKTVKMRHMESRYLVHTYRTHFLAGYDRKNQKDMLGRMYEGVIAKLRPHFENQCQEIELDMEIDIANLVKPLPTLPIRQGEIALPSQLTQHISTTIRFPKNRGLLVAGFANPYEDEGQRSFSPARKKEHLLFYYKLLAEN